MHRSPLWVCLSLERFSIWDFKSVLIEFKVEKNDILKILDAVESKRKLID